MNVGSRLAAVAVALCLAPALALALAAPSAHAVGATVAPHPRPAAPNIIDFGSRFVIVGDSLTVGTLYCSAPYPCLPRLLSAAGVTARSDARVGRKVAEGMAVLASTSHLRSASTVVIALGTNDLSASRTTARGWVAAARALVGPDVTLAWVDLSLSGARFTTSQARINAGLLDGVHADDVAQLRRGAQGRAALLDWSRYAADHRIPHGRDGIHYSPEGYQARAAFYVGSLTGASAYAGYVRS